METTKTNSEYADEPLALPGRESEESRVREMAQPCVDTADLDSEASTVEAVPDSRLEVNSVDELLQSAATLYLKSLATGRELLYQRVDLGRVLIQLKAAVGHKKFLPSATILNMGSGFIHKDLCSAGTITAGSACVFGCVYCSVGSTMFRSPDTAILRLLGIEHRDAVIRRLAPAKTLREQLTFRDGSPRFKDPGDRRVVFLSPIVDPLPNIELFEESLELILLIMELTNWDVRILTKSMLVRKLAKRIPEKYRLRIIYGLSLGIVDDRIGKAVEKLTSPPTARIKAYRELQEQGLRTYSMHCPVLPQTDYKAYAERLAASANWEADELVWVEALNSRGPSNERTIDALGGAGFSAEADLLASVTSSHDAWEFGYNRPLFQALATVCPLGKLRYLVYVDDADRDYWITQIKHGAVVLGKEDSLDENDDE